MTTASQRVITLERFRPLAERYDFWAATEADACNAYGEFNPLALAHYAEFIWPAVGDHHRFREAFYA